MKISTITAQEVLDYLRAEQDEIGLMEPIMDAAKAYIMDETALSSEEIDCFPDLYIAFMVLCQDFYDNRSYTQETKTVSNRTVETILGHHRMNLV